MKRIISILCCLCLLIQPIASLAADREIAYSTTKATNPILNLPIHEDAIMKNGVMVIEGEELQYDPKNVAIVDDAESSGGKGLKIIAANRASAPVTDVSGPDFKITYRNDLKGSTMYYYWFRIKTPQYNQNLFVDMNNTGEWKSTGTSLRVGTSGVNQYMWKLAASQTLNAAGDYTMAFAYREGKMLLDKVIITTDANFTPEGMDPDPFVSSGGGDNENAGEADAVNWQDTSKIRVYPKEGVHPQLMINAQTIEKVKERVAKNAISKKIYDAHIRAAQKPLADVSDAATVVYNDVVGSLSTVEARAFAYAFGELDAAVIRETIEFFLYAFSVLDLSQYDSTYMSRHAGSIVVAGSKLYDWAYDVWTPEERQRFIDMAYPLLKETEVGWPPVDRGFWTGHALEGGILEVSLSFAVAIFDEDPSAYDIVGGILYGPLFEAARSFIKADHTARPGSYFGASVNSMRVAEDILKILGDPEPVAENMNRVFRTRIYRTMPNGMFFREDDDFYLNNYVYDSYTVRHNDHYLFYGYANDDPVLARHGALEYGISNSTPSDLAALLYIDFDNLDYEDLTELPLTNFTGNPMTTMSARTHWQWGVNSPTVAAYVTMREYNGGDHNHRDVGGFQLFYKGFLAQDSGLYSYNEGAVHMHNWQDRTIAHNCMLIDNFDPNFYEPQGNVYLNDGGQKRPTMIGNGGWRDTTFMFDPGYTYAYNKAKFAGPNTHTPAFSYISSDLSQAYNDIKRNRYKVKTDGYERSVVFMDLYNEDYPAAMIVYDNVASLDASYKKSWLLHSQLAPIVDEKRGVTTIYRNDFDYNGKLVNKTLTPSVTNAEFEVIGGDGREYEVNGVNYPAPANLKSDINKARDFGNYTIYLRPKAPAQEDKFLNVMYVTDYDRNLPELPIYKEFGTVYTGATIMDRTVIFSLSRENLKYAFNLNVRNNGYDTVKCLVTDLTPGKWQISGNGTSFIVESKVGEECAYFEVAPGYYTVAPVSGGEVTTFDKGAVEKDDFGDFRIARNKNIMYQPKPGKLYNGVPYVAVDGVLTQLGNSSITSVSEDGRTVHMKNDAHTLVLTADAPEALYDGKPIPMTQPAKMYNGELYSAVNDLTRFFFIKSYEYSEFGRVLILNLRNISAIEGIDSSKRLTPVSVSGDAPHSEQFSIDNCWDNDLTTYYGTAGQNKQLVLDYGESVYIDRVSIAWYGAHKRKQYFDLLVSDDGTNWSYVLEDGVSSGKTQGLEAFKIKASGRYLKMISNGNSVQADGYNSIYEVIAETK